MNEIYFIGSILYVLWTIRKIRDLEKDIKQLRRNLSILHWELKKSPSGSTGKPKPSRKTASTPPNSTLFLKGGELGLTIASALPKALLSALSGQRRRR